RNEVLGEALTELLRQIQLLRDQPVPADELADTKAFMVGSFPLQIETPQQVASRVAANRLLGLPEDALETYRSRVAALDAVTVQEVFRRHVDPGKVAMVVVGDATVLMEALRIFGPIRLEDVEGNRLDMTALAPRGRSREFSAVGLEPLTLDYQLSFQGNPVGSTRRTLAVNPDGTLAFASRTELGPQEVVQTVTVQPEALEFVSSEAAVTAPGQALGGEVRREGNRLVGSLTTPMGEIRVDMEVPDGVMVSDMLELALWVTELEEGTEFDIPVANVQTGTVENVRIQVVERTELTVPAGTFPVFRVEVGGSEAQTVWVRVEAPHIVVGLVPASQPVSLELVSAGGGG
ncbi:MAG TPA: hypothetical protein VLA43_09230, partial [Longimicrobiales bacterium]|nr:hypothetical protein [Longimicrobiales bacterium]